MTAIRRRRWTAWLPLAAVAVVAAVALAIGTQRSGGTPSVATRTLSIASQIRCPVCTGETAAESQTTAAVEIRAIIRQGLLRGESQAGIIAGIEQDFHGSWILERPPARGSGLLLWWAPVVAVVVAVAALAFGFRRWRSRTVGRPDDEDTRLVREMLAREQTVGG